LAVLLVSFLEQNCDDFFCGYWPELCWFGYHFFDQAFFFEVGTTTTNIDGTYGLTFTPQVPGEYLIIATFAGSDSYYSSYATTYISVSEAPATTPAPTAPPASLADLYFLPATIGIIIAIAVVGAILALMLRKR
jgi:hypothetical protein